MVDDRAALKSRFAALSVMPAAAAKEPPRPTMLREAVPAPSAITTFTVDKIQLKVRRTQNRSLTGLVTFSVHVIAEVSEEARRAIDHYRLGKTILYQKDLELKMTLNVFLALWRFLVLLLTRKRWQITIDDLVHGRTLSAKNVIELLSIETEM